MYGVKNTATGTSGAGLLAYTGFQSAWWLFAALTMIFAGVALVQLVRRPRTHLP